jgi:hypothetical protein
MAASTGTFGQQGGSRPNTRRIEAGRRLRARVRRVMPLFTLSTLTLAFRLPVLINAGAVNSDAAVVGLQAMHILRGEWSWTLWGASYQAPVDSLIAALMFIVLGPTPLALMLVPFLLELLLVWLYFGIARLTFRPWPAALLTMPVVFTPMAINSSFLYVQRQACITLFAASIWLVAGASGSRKPRLRLLVGAWAGLLTLYLDLFAIQWVGPFVLFVFASTWKRPRWSWRWLGHLCVPAFGLLLGWLSVRQLRSFSPPAGQLAISFDRVPYNFQLLSDQSLPWALSYKIFAHQGTLYAEPFSVPEWFRDVQLVGAGLVVLAMVAGASLFWVRRIPWLTRSLALFGMALVACSLAGFLVSGMPVDMWSTRYLAPVILAMPFALGPVACLLRTPSFAVLCAPYLAAVAVGGWVSYGITFVSGGLPVRSARGIAREELDVGRLLRDHHVRYAAAQYWLAYRLTFLFRENPVVVPLNGGEDRYPKYRQGFAAAEDVAYIFHPSEPRASPADVERMLSASHERYNVADFTVFIEHRR